MVAVYIAVAGCLHLHRSLNQMCQNFAIDTGRLRLRLAEKCHNQFSLQVQSIFQISLIYEMPVHIPDHKYYK
jgi:hypothetical protein